MVEQKYYGFGSSLESALDNMRIDAKESHALQAEEKKLEYTLLLELGRQRGRRDVSQAYNSKKFSKLFSTPCIKVEGSNFPELYTNALQKLGLEKFNSKTHKLYVRVTGTYESEKGFPSGPRETVHTTAKYGNGLF